MVFAKESPEVRFAVGRHFAPIFQPQKARMCVGCDIGIEEMKIDEMREYPVLTRSKDLAPSLSGQSHDSPLKKERRNGLSHVVMTM